VRACQIVPNGRRPSARYHTQLWYALRNLLVYCDARLLTHSQLIAKMGHHSSDSESVSARKKGKKSTSKVEKAEKGKQYMQSQHPVVLY
jgi:hypothetical protein